MKPRISTQQQSAQKSHLYRNGIGAPRTIRRWEAITSASGVTFTSEVTPTSLTTCSFTSKIAPACPFKAAIMAAGLASTLPSSSMCATIATIDSVTSA